jgi:hypothetical protein
MKAKPSTRLKIKAFAGLPPVCGNRIAPGKEHDNPADHRAMGVAVAYQPDENLAKHGQSPFG